MSYLAPVPSPASQDDAAVDTVDLLPAAVEAQSEEIKARYSKIFGV